MPNQKAMIDFNTIDNWQGLGDFYLSVSDDGKYFAYNINKPNSTTRYAAMILNQLDSLVVQSTNNTWRLAFAGSEPGVFTDDSKQYIFLDMETLFFLQLGKAQSRSVKDVASFKVSQNKWLAYQLKGRDSLTLQNLATGKIKYFTGVKDYAFDNSGGWFTCQTESNELVLYNLVTGIDKHYPSAVAYQFAKSGKGILVKTATTLQYISLLQEDLKIIWTSKEKIGIGSYNIDNEGMQVVFNVLDSSKAAQGEVNTSGIWYYKAGMDKAVLKVTDETQGISDGLTIKSTVSFTDNGHYIKFALQSRPETKKLNPDIAQVEVWNHQDLYLQFNQSEQLKRSKQFVAVVNIENGKVIPIESNDKSIYLLQGDFAVVKKYESGKHGDRFWEMNNADSTWLVSLKDGTNHLLPIRAGNSSFCFSPDGNYLVFSDPDKDFHYFSYNLHSDILRDISPNVPKGQLVSVDPKGGSAYPIGLAAWLANNNGVLVYDNYDIWRLDLTGKEPAINITNGFGQSNNTKLSLLTTQRFENSFQIIQPNESLLLRAFNTQSKKSGFYQKADLNVGTPKLLYMGGYFTEIIRACHDPNLSNRGMGPVKARNRDFWIVQRQSTNDAPNYYETTDFKSFRRLTNFQPQKKFRWLSEELHSFNHLDGETGQGILYKPEGFDPEKKYPVLIVFYGTFSNNLNQFRDPAYNFTAITPGMSPAWFLNNGYLVFIPDIAVVPLKYGPKAFSVIEGAVQYFKTLPYVDGDKLGCASHSWSAKLGGYIFTHSKSIAATAISEGMMYGNLINTALSAREDGTSFLKTAENDFQFGNLWKNKELWLDQTTVLNVDKATSPLLLFCNKKSSPDYQNQTLQFFTALRRLDKNVWWLRYDKGQHTLSDIQEVRDYTIRYTQFFDHYLKEAPAPQWMTQGIPLKLKGIESKYELDPQGTCTSPNGEACSICRAWNAQYKRTPEMVQKELKDWVLDTDIATELERTIKERRKQLDKEGEIQTKEVLKKLNAER